MTHPIRRCYIAVIAGIIVLWLVLPDLGLAAEFDKGHGGFRGKYSRRLDILEGSLR